MTDHLLGIVLGHPAVLLVVGRLMCAGAAALALLGLRLDRLVLRLARPGMEAPTVDALLPSWLGWAVPETFVGWLLIAMVFAIGFCLAHGARAIERLTRSR